MNLAFYDSGNDEIMNNEDLTGFEKTRFVDEIDEEFLCPICFCVFRDPVMLPCQHIFCKVCLTDWSAKCRQSNNKDPDDATFQCPSCRCKVTSEPQTARMAKNLSSKFRMFCKYKNVTNCPFVASMTETEQHESKCDFKPEQCPNAACQRTIAQCHLAQHRRTCDAIDDFLDNFYNSAMRNFMGKTYKNVTELTKMHEKICSSVAKMLTSAADVDDVDVEEYLGNLPNYYVNRLNYFKFRNRLRIVEALTFGFGVAAFGGIVGSLLLAASVPISSAGLGTAVGGVVGTIGALIPNIYSWHCKKAE